MSCATRQTVVNFTGLQPVLIVLVAICLMRLLAVLGDLNLEYFFQRIFMLSVGGSVSSF